MKRVREGSNEETGEVADFHDDVAKIGATTAKCMKTEANEASHIYTNTDIQANFPNDFPRLGIYHPDFQKAEHLVTSIVEGVINTVTQLKEEMGYENEELNRACGTTRNGLGACRTPSDLYPTVGPTACVGATGKGKSSSINSVTGQRKAAYEHTGSKRGTYVSHEFAKSLITQTAEYVVETFYNDEPTIRRTVRRFVAYVVEGNALEDGEESDDEELDEEDKATLLFRKQTALECLTDALCDSVNFSNPNMTDTYFRRQLKQGTDDVISELVDLVKRAIRQEDKTLPEMRRYEITNSAELQETLKRIGRPSFKGTQRVASSQWPFISLIRIRAKTDALQAGMTIADTPGVGDINMHVVAQAESYMRTAGSIMIVHEYDRSADGQGFLKLLQRVKRLGKMNNAILVVTKIDQQPDYAEEDWRDLAEGQVARLQKAESDIEAIERQITAAEQAKLQSSRLDEFKKYDTDLQQLRQEVVEAGRVKRQTHILLRCEKIKEEMGELMESHDSSGPGPRLEVFPISNTEYQDHLAHSKDSSKTPPTLDLEATGVPALRRRLLELAAAGKHQALQHIARELLPWTINGINGILTRPAFERKRDLRKVMEKILDDKRMILDNLRLELLTSYEDQVDQCVLDQQEKWVAVGADTVGGWARIGASTSKAICARNGEYKRKQRGGAVVTYNWNRELLDVCQHDLRSACKAYKRQSESILTQFAAEVKKVFDELRHAIAASEHSKGMNMRDFDEFIRQTGVAVANDLEHQRDALGEIIGEVCNALTMAPEDGFSRFYIRDAMAETYRQCAAVNAEYVKSVTQGRASGRRKDEGKPAGGRMTITGARVGLIQAKLRGGQETGLFKHVACIGRRRLGKDLLVWAQGEDGEQDEVQERGPGRGWGWRPERGKQVVLDRFHMILADFDRRFKDAEAKAEENPLAVMKVQEALGHAQRTIQGPLKAYLDECRAFEERQA